MRVLVISDIHANLAAFEAVLEAAGKVHAVWCLGDVVGYGPNPNECVELLLEQPNLTCLLGNHDAACIGEMSVSTFNREARMVVEWTQSVMTEENNQFLKERPLVSVMDEVTLVHGSPRQPIYEYMLDVKSAFENLSYFDTDFCFLGHSHLPLMFTYYPEDEHVKLRFPIAGEPLSLQPRSIINPGSVGQPRDRDPRASFAIYDTDSRSWDLQRVEYDILRTQEQMREVNLPDRHINRLSGGW
ncbi:MAG TPA: metallophosphoesterase family protein [Anaerolineales bacterium]|nr:metallophosphoesterase family protein [Anaerolineales bacterium]